MSNALPLDGIRVVEFAHMVMGPVCSLMLADLGADVIKVEPPGGDKTRYLKGSGAGYFPMYNRNKRSICLNVKSEVGKGAALRLLDTADVFVENFRPGAMDRLGFGYQALSTRNPQLIYCSEKGFLDGPYAERTALDEVAQMMSGLSYMTGPPGKPLRAGASVIDVQGGMFGALGVLAALYQRRETHRGQHVTASLFESAVFLIGQHMAQMAVTGRPAEPMPARISAWAIYDVFETVDGQPVFVGVVTDGQWKIFCDAFQLIELAADQDLRTNDERVRQRARIIPLIRDTFGQLTKAELLAKLEQIGLPFAPINRPQDMFNDVHLNAGGALLEISLPDGDNRGKTTKLPALPLRMGAQRLDLRRDVPRFGENTEEILAELGFSAKEIRGLTAHSG